MSITTHQKRILAALVELEIIMKRAVSRRDICLLLRNGQRGVTLKAMLALEIQGLAGRDNHNAVEFVQSKRCTCGCDRWLSTQEGFSLAKSFKVKFSDNIVFMRDRAKAVSRAKGE